MNSFRDAASTATRLPAIGVDPSTAQGLAKTFAIGASECLADAQSLQDGWSDRTGQFIITFHAIELGLKAFLISTGKTERELQSRRFGDNLAALYDEAIANGMTLRTPNAREFIEWINEWHCHGVKIRYLFTTERTLPICETLFPLAGEIISKTGMVPNATRS